MITFLIRFRSSFGSFWAPSTNSACLLRIRCWPQIWRSNDHVFRMRFGVFSGEYTVFFGRASVAPRCRLFGTMLQRMSKQGPAPRAQNDNIGSNKLPFFLENRTVLSDADAEVGTVFSARPAAKGGTKRATAILSRSSQKQDVL